MQSFVIMSKNFTFHLHYETVEPANLKRGESNLYRYDTFINLAFSVLGIQLIFLLWDEDR